MTPELRISREISIKAKTYDGGWMRCRTEAEIIGDWAIHPTLLSGGIWSMRLWTVTHCPSGFEFKGELPTLEAARKWAELLDAQMPKFRNKSGIGKVHREVAAQIKAEMEK